MGYIANFVIFSLRIDKLAIVKLNRVINSELGNNIYVCICEKKGQNCEIKKGKCCVKCLNTINEYINSWFK